MSFMHQFGLLVAIAIPAAVILFSNLALYAAGERGTLILPGLEQSLSGVF